MIAAALIVALILLVAGIAFFAASETAFLSLNRVHLKSLVRTKARGAVCAMRLWLKMDNLLSLVLIGTNFLDAAAASLSTLLAMRIGGTGSVFIATLVTTAVITVFGEIVPKTFAIAYTDKTALFAAPILLAMQRVFYPVIALFSLISRGVNFVAACLFRNDDRGVTEAEIKMMIDVSTAEGTLEKSERDMIYKIFTLGDTPVRSFMRHRSLVVSVSPDDNIEAVSNAFLRGYSHVPVIDGGEVIGVLEYTSVLFAAGDSAASFVRRNMTQPLFIPETHTAFAALERFKEAGTDFAVVLDEQGCFSGIVTMDCLCRVVFANMADDNLAHSPSPLERVKVITDDECIIPGDIRIEDANELLGTDLASDDFTTMGGWLLEQFGYLPSTGEMYILSPRPYGAAQSSANDVLPPLARLRGRKACDAPSRGGSAIVPPRAASAVAGEKMATSQIAASSPPPPLDGAIAFVVEDQERRRILSIRVKRIRMQHTHQKHNHLVR